MDRGGDSLTFPELHAASQAARVLAVAKGRGCREHYETARTAFHYRPMFQGLRGSALARQRVRRWDNSLRIQRLRQVHLLGQLGEEAVEAVAGPPRNFVAETAAAFVLDVLPLTAAGRGESEGGGQVEREQLAAMAEAEEEGEELLSLLEGPGAEIVPMPEELGED